MLLRIVGDYSAESGLGPIVLWLSGPTREAFARREYGAGLSTIGVVLTSRDPSLELQPRIRYSRENRTLNMDVMFRLAELSSMRTSERSLLVLSKLREEVPRILIRRKIADFDVQAFMTDWQAWIDERAEGAMRASNS